MDLRAILEAVQEWPPWITYAALLFGAFVEYVFPPFPGDTVVVAGAVLVTAFGWSLWPVLALVTAGAVLGALCDWALGRWLARTGRLERLRPGWREALAGVSRQLERHGAWYLAVNRFVPGVRAFFFVAAGMAGLRWPGVVLWAGVSALAWNALLLQVGFLLGDNLDGLEEILTQYATVVWIILAVVAAVLVVRFVRSRRAAASRNRTDRSDRT